jgi:hypothetical protein
MSSSQLPEKSSCVQAAACRQKAQLSLSHLSFQPAIIRMLFTAKAAAAHPRRV